MPTVALRPIIVPAELRDTAVFLCSVADEALDIDPLAPPRRLIKTAAALGDELRLRILRVLQGEELSASEIAERMAVERTSLHHHLGILRWAGLLTIRDEGERGWRYALREDVIAGLGLEVEALPATALTDSGPPRLLRLACIGHPMAVFAGTGTNWAADWFLGEGNRCWREQISPSGRR